MSFKPRAILKVEGDIRLLPFWAEYHRHIFDSGTVVIGPTVVRGDVERIVRRLLPGWTTSYSANNREETNNYTPSIFQKIYDYGKKWFGMTDSSIEIASNEFLIDVAFPLSTLHRYQYEMREETYLTANNIVDFLHATAHLNHASEETTNMKITFLSVFEEDVCIPLLERRCKELEETDYVHYLDAYIHSDADWGEDRVILQEDTNLLEGTNFDGAGHCIFSMEPYIQLTRFPPLSKRIERNLSRESSKSYRCTSRFLHNEFLKSMVESKIAEVTASQHINLETYHSNITEEDHTKIINAMPWKKTESPEIREFAEYMESRVSGILGKKVRIFNDDIWVRICRPSSVTDTDYNPCHRDIYLDFYRNIVNIYVPIVGSNEKSSLAMQSGSHLWNESDLVVTKGGAYFPSSGKKYSVDAILRSKQPLDMVRPNPREDEFILFSPYLIHGCSSNNNVDTTRMSVEIRFIADDESAKMQEGEFTKFLKERVWR